MAKEASQSRCLKRDLNDKEKADKKHFREKEQCKDSWAFLRTRRANGSGSRAIRRVTGEQGEAWKADGRQNRKSRVIYLFRGQWEPLGTESGFAGLSGPCYLEGNARQRGKTGARDEPGSGEKRQAMLGGQRRAR